MLDSTTPPSGAPPFPVPSQGAPNEFYWQGAAEHKLMILRCQNCQTYIHLPRPVCRVCGSFGLAPEQVSGRGTLYSFTETRKAFHPFFARELPYTIAVVELVEQPNLQVFTNMVGTTLELLRIGMAVEVDFARRPGVTVPVFRAATDLT